MTDPTTEPLAAKTCTPCKGGVPPMTPKEAEAHRGLVPKWSLKDGGVRIERTWTFRNFAEAFELVRKTSDLAEAEGHHPDISFGWGYVTVSLHTHKIKGLHENDFIIAAKLDELA